MAKKKKLLSRLFGSGRDEAEQPEERYEEKPVPGQPPPDDTLEPDPFLLVLPENHATQQLWTLWTRHAGWHSAPGFRFAGPDGSTDILHGAAVRQELARLLMAVNSTANKRLSRVFPKGKDKPPEELPDLDAEAVAFVTNDSLSAWVFAYPPVGKGRELDHDAVVRALAEKQVRFGLDEALLKRMPGDPERYFHLFLAARGREAVHGKDGRVYDLFTRKPERRYRVDEFNRVDYASLSFVQNAEEGDTICRIIPPTAGQAGMDVLGKVLPARDGKAAVVPKGRNTALSENGELLVATRTGHVEFSGRSFQVKPVLEIDGNVDFSTGHINFLGDVHIHGDICAGFTVRAMGNITVDGVVEAGTVEAGGDLIIVKGAQGDNRAVLRSSHSIFAKYLENCCAYARENLTADCLINCDVYCDGGVTVRTGRGTIIGGSIRAAHEVSAAVVGSRTETHTDVILGGLPCQEFDREVLTREVAELEEELEKIERQPESPTKFSRTGKVRMQLSLSRSKLEQFRQDLEKTEQESGEPGIRRLVCGIAYPGTSVTIGPGSYFFRQETRPVNASLDGDGEIQII